MNARHELAARINDLLPLMTRRDAELIRDAVLADVPLLMQAIEADHFVCSASIGHPEHHEHERWVTPWCEVTPTVFGIPIVENPDLVGPDDLVLGPPNYQEMPDDQH